MYARSRRLDRRCCWFFNNLLHDFEGAVSAQFPRKFHSLSQHGFRFRRSAERPPQRRSPTAPSLNFTRILPMSPSRPTDLAPISHGQRGQAPSISHPIAIAPFQPPSSFSSSTWLLLRPKQFGRDDDYDGGDVNEKPQRLARRTKLLEAAPLSPFGEDEGTSVSHSCRLQIPIYSRNHEQPFSIRNYQPKQR